LFYFIYIVSCHLTDNIEILQVCKLALKTIAAETFVNSFELKKLFNFSFGQKPGMGRVVGQDKGAKDNIAIAELKSSYS
jgi:hypothetical protein